MIEICCGSFYDAKQAYLGGAKRIELNSALHLGGLTPSIASLVLTKENTDLKIISMVRPRGAGFCYIDEDISTMMLDAKILMNNKSDGLAFGFLTQNKEIDIENTKKMIDVIKSSNGEAVFHRAFDCVLDPYQSIEILIELGIDRVLTSGLQNKAFDGAELLADLQKKYGKKIEILGGSGINYKNVCEFINKTGLNQIHSSCKEFLEDVTTISKGVSYAFDDKKTCKYDVVSKELVSKLILSVYNNPLIIS